MMTFRPVVKSSGLMTATLLCLTLAPSWLPVFAQSNDPIVLSFSSVGDSRQDPNNPDPSTLPLSVQDQIWLQNTKAWSSILNSIQSRNVPNVPNLLFFDGDMIQGYGDANVPLEKLKFWQQYGFWRGMVAGDMEIHLYVVPVPGNHEVQCPPGKIALPQNEDAWRDNMGDLILDTSRFQNLFGVQPRTWNQELLRVWTQARLHLLLWRDHTGADLACRLRPLPSRAR